MKRYLIIAIALSLLLNTVHNAIAAEEKEDPNGFVNIYTDSIYSEEDIAMGKALLQAIYAENTDRILECVSHSVPIDYTDENGNTGLMIAAALGNPTIVQMLLNEKASVDLENSFGENALEKLLILDFYFIKPSHDAVIEKLVLHGADLYKIDKDSKTVCDKLLKLRACPQKKNWYLIAQKAEEKAQKSLLKTIRAHLPALPALPVLPAWPRLPFCMRNLLH